MALTERAIAEAGDGKEDLAICHYQAAQTIEPRLYGADLSAFGAPGALLMHHPWGVVGQEPSPRSAQASEAEKRTVTRPEIVSRRFPVFPDYAKSFRIQGSVVFESIIDERGEIRDPVLLSSGPTLGFDASVLDAVCEWRFKPALFEGKPVDVFYTMTVTFKVGR